ncbi:MAG: zinc ribbon domain-containing protein [Lachnospiraceae bacterium]|nr:zinc ribbon domain-containing protein [Lachnospiraceae bacterium]
MYDIFPLIIILIVIIALIIKYLYVQAHILSSKEFRKAAEKKSFIKQIKKTTITCDYCGYVIDTAKDTKCPNCGAVYGEDKELKKPYKVDEKAVEKMANAAANDAVSKAHEKARETLKQLRIAILVFVVVFALLLVRYMIADKTKPYDSQRYRQNEEVDNSDYRDFTLIESPDLTIFDKEDVTLKLVSVYADKTNGQYNDVSYAYRVGFSLINKRNEPIHLSLKCFGINGRSRAGDYFYIYGNFDSKSDVTFYENVYGEYFESIDEIVLGKCSLHNEESNLYKNDKMETYKLNDKGYTVITADKDMGSVIFENDKVRIRCIGKEKLEYGYEMWIENLSDSNYYIEASDMKIDDSICDSYILHENGFPAGYTLHDDSLNGLGDKFRLRSADAKVSISLSFSDFENPQNDFSTGYFTLKQ